MKRNSGRSVFNLGARGQDHVGISFAGDEKTPEGRARETRLTADGVAKEETVKAL